MKTGIYGGTFDPPHMGHISAARAAVGHVPLDRLIMIPAATPPHKELPPEACTSQQRLEMTKAAAAGIECAEVSALEIERGGRSYTADTLKQLRELYPDDEFYLLMGTDMFLSIETWRSFDSIAASATPAVFSRTAGDGAKIAEYSERLYEKYGIRAVTVENDAVEISSSEIRALLPKRLGREYLSDEVYSYIIKNRCYGARPELDWLREKAHAMLKPKRVPHVKGCETEAEMLAKRWGADVEAAREAAILHDITKKDELEAQLLLCEKYGIINDNVEKSDYKLLHSKTGAALARDLFGVSDEVFSAIFWHTTGREDMTLLEKIIYLADYIEPTRDFEGLSELRGLAYENIDKAMALGLRMSLEDMRERGIVPHPRTAAALSWLENKGF